MPGSPRILVNDSNKFKSRETEKNIISEETVESKDGTTVFIEIMFYILRNGHYNGDKEWIDIPEKVCSYV